MESFFCAHLPKNSKNWQRALKYFYKDLEIPVEELLQYGTVKLRVYIIIKMMPQ